MKRALPLLFCLLAFACGEDEPAPATDAGSFNGSGRADAAFEPDGAVTDRGSAPDLAPADAQPRDQALPDQAPLDQAPPPDAGPPADMAAEDMLAPDLAPPDAEPADMAPLPPAGSVYDPGPYEVRRARVDQGAEGAPKAAEIYEPVGAAQAPVVLWQHGFLLDVGLYTDLLTHLASHGFVVVAPQMYPADGIPLGKPTAAEEAAAAQQVLAWIDDGLGDLVDVPLAPGAPGIAGHSRGGKVTWLLLSAGADRARAIAGVDPVDGQGGPLGGEARVLDLDLDFGGIPKLIIGTGLGRESVGFLSPACAPEGDAHVRFYTRTPGPIWHGVATDFGHNDMLDDDCGLLCLACPRGPEPRTPMRRYVAGQLVALFRAALMGDVDAFGWLEDAEAAPLAATAERR
ncbi:MAG: hypothetical protein H6702_08505 [Myxococcales bacterium]|nr:hypothetical protein [Myxococcales bacterium]